MARKKKQRAAAKPFTAQNLIEYLQTYPADSQIVMTHVSRRGREVFGYPVENFTLITDTPDNKPHLLIEIGRAVKVETAAQRITRQQKEKQEQEAKEE